MRRDVALTPQLFRHLADVGLELAAAARKCRERGSGWPG